MESKVKNPIFITLSHTMKNASAYEANSMHTEDYNFSSQIPAGYSIMAIRGVKASGGYFLTSSFYISDTSVYAILNAEIAIAPNTYNITFDIICCKTELLGTV